MVKGNPKSSATSGTRKKHLKKHAPADEPPPKDKKPKGKVERGKKKEPRVKMYIPPVKPAPVVPDPLETTGLAHTLPADLLVVLRNISKKAQVTKTRALEELQAAWVNQCLKEGRDSLLVYTLVEMLPVWLHHVSSLFVNPSRRIRFLAASLHSSLLQIPPVREQILYFLGETASTSQLENILGTWCLATHDVDRSVSAAASKSWKETILTESTEGSSPTKHLLLNDQLRSSLKVFVQRVVLDPGGVYAYLNPSPPPAPASVASMKRGSGKASAVSTPRRDDGDQTPRSKQDEQEESEQDRKARLRIGALGAARWLIGLTSKLSEDDISFYSNPALWTILQSSESCPWVAVESFGFAQPNVRKAGWGLVQSLLVSQKDNLEALVPTLSTAILRSAWLELDTNVQGVMWQPLLTFLKQFPQSWTLDENKKDDDDDGSESDAESDAEDAPRNGAPSSSPAARQPSQAYQEFLQFLQLGCSGSPIQGYPTVVIIVSTIPSPLLNSPASPLSQFFASFWAAVEGRALSSLHRVAASAAFLSSLLECIVFLIKRIRNDSSRPDEGSSSPAPVTAEAEDSSNAVLREQFSLVWEQLSSKKLKVEERAAARLLAQTLESLFSINQRTFDAAWEFLVQGIKASSTKEDNVHLISAVLKVFYDRFKKGTVLRQRAEDLMKDILEVDIARCESLLNVEQVPSPEEDVTKEKVSFELLVGILEQFREGLFFDESFCHRLDALLSQHAFKILSLSPSLFLSYLIHRKNEAKASEVWHHLLSSIASSSIIDQVQERKSIGRLSEAAQRGQLPRYLKPQSGELDSLVGGLLEKALGGPMGSDELSLVGHILSCSDYFLSRSGLDTFFQVIIGTFTSNVTHVIEGQDTQTSVFDVVMHLVDAVFTKILEESRLLQSLLPDLFLFAFLLSPVGDQTGPQATATTRWNEWLGGAGDDYKKEIMDIIKTKLKFILGDTNASLTPKDILVMIAVKPPGLQVDILQDIFLSSSKLDAMLSTLSSDPIDPAITVLDPLLPPPSRSPLVKDSDASKLTDRRGFSAYARIVDGLLQAFVDERWLAKRNLWALRHFHALSIYAHDLQNVPSAASRSPVFDDKVTLSSLANIIDRVRQVSVYLLNSAAGKEDDTWRRVVVDRLLNDSARKDPREGLNQVQTFLFDVVSYAKQGDSTRDARVLKLILDPLLVDGVHVAEADMWIQLVRKLEKTAPQTSMVIISAVTGTGAEPPKLDRYRNELAAALLGIKPNKANTEGLLSLRKLAASAPDPDGAVIFLPPPRAINVVKACQGWVLAEGDDDDEEIDEEVQSAMLPIFMHLAPILQNVPGAHWGFVFDVLEAVLENSSGEKDGEDEQEADEGPRLVGLARALRLVVVLEDLAKRNKGLMAEWHERRMGILKMIRDLNVIRNDSELQSSAPRSACRKLVLSIVQHLPSTLLDQDTLSKMCHLIEDTSPVVQKMAYQLLKAAAKKRTEYFIIEAGVDTEATVQATLPPELLEIISRQIHFGDGGTLEDEEGSDQTQNLFGYLLGWMLVFDLFQDASFKVKSNYIEQLRNLNVVINRFVPCFLGLLSLDQGGLLKAFKLSIWAVDQFYVDLYQPGNPHTIPVLTAHVYYRALLTIPSLIHAWVLDCKDRQLTNTVTTYTSTHFSPVLIRAELEHVRSHATSDGLADDSMTVKVAGAVNEVVAAYSVDDHQLEIKLRIPADWPLHKIEVRDVKRVGVDENRWRAWVLGVQQTIWAHNGRIIDGLGIFKKNVTLHFEGQVECAICYSIISVMDGSLPKRPCKTCKNRFHAGCLYKWFNSSHSSSCPLCRSDII
ncbi:hypothetical protein GALMADRAFT_752797 [Galerina marginata CBS 339.88]|uniref:E3 ubiquitin-protein ligase listerin n=1 Tax=Galerina marginata (strain CBS 339.88) TaxID=685588 RepID=A0A067T0L3_GALM3|nr:hypothetical protein GALMADRAFT_752797 [Galerina marginata CBS 339.88]